MPSSKASQYRVGQSSIETLQKTWEELGKDDPLWAVMSHADKRGGRWQVSDFLATGEADVSRVCNLLVNREFATPPFRHVLDFGCGVGRLAMAWASRAELVCGLDISAAMLSRADLILRDRQNVRLHHNTRNDLRLFGDGTFDLVTSLICLQHMTWGVAANYLREFARVCEPGGLVVFQLPSRRIRSSILDHVRRRVVDALPFGLGRLYRRWRHGTSAVFEMHFTPSSDVESVCRGAGLSLLFREADVSAGAGTEGYLYVFRKSAER